MQHNTPTAFLCKEENLAFHEKQKTKQNKAKEVQWEGEFWNCPEKNSGKQVLPTLCLLYSFCPLPGEKQPTGVTVLGRLVSSVREGVVVLKEVGLFHWKTKGGIMEKLLYVEH